MFVYILRAIRASRCRERRYADLIFIQIYFRMHHFVVKFSKFSRATGGTDPLTKILRRFLGDSGPWMPPAHRDTAYLCCGCRGSSVGR